MIGKYLQFFSQDNLHGINIHLVFVVLNSTTWRDWSFLSNITRVLFCYFELQEDIESMRLSLLSGCFSGGIVGPTSSKRIWQTSINQIVNEVLNINDFPVQISTFGVERLAWIHSTNHELLGCFLIWLGRSEAVVPSMCRTQYSWDIFLEYLQTSPD